MSTPDPQLLASSLFEFFNGFDQDQVDLLGQLVKAHRTWSYEQLVAGDFVSPPIFKAFKRLGQAVENSGSKPLYSEVCERIGDLCEAQPERRLWSVESWGVLQYAVRAVLLDLIGYRTAAQLAEPLTELVHAALVTPPEWRHVVLDAVGTIGLSDAAALPERV